MFPVFLERYETDSNTDLNHGEHSRLALASAWRHVGRPPRFPIRTKWSRPCLASKPRPPFLALSTRRRCRSASLIRSFMRHLRFVDPGPEGDARVGISVWLRVLRARLAEERPILRETPVSTQRTYLSRGKKFADTCRIWVPENGRVSHAKGGGRGRKLLLSGTAVNR